MKFSTSKSELQQALQKLSKATPTRSTLPILSCVLITATNEKTSLRTTDLELTIDLEISVSIEEEGSAAIPDSGREVSPHCLPCIGEGSVPSRWAMSP